MADPAKQDARVVGIKQYHKGVFKLTNAALDLDSQGKRGQALANYKGALQQIASGLAISCDDKDCQGPEWDKVRSLKTKMRQNEAAIRKRVAELEAKVLVAEAEQQVANSRILGSGRPVARSAPVPRRPAAASPAAASRSTAARTASYPVGGQSGTGAGKAARQTSAPTPQTTGPGTGADLLKNVDPKLRDQILNEVQQDCANVKMDDIIGLKGAKAALDEIVVLPALRPELFTGLRTPARGLLLFGPPGNGKTMLAKAIANEAKSTFFNISASTLTSKWMGESEKLVRALFLCGRAMQPSIIFIDEVDSILTKRGESDGESSRRLKTELLVSFDGVGSSAEDRVLVMGATNLPHELDDAGLRRFTKRIYIPMPAPEARQALLLSLMKNAKANVSPQEMAEVIRATEGYSGSDLTALARDAALGPIRELGARIRDVPADKVRAIGKQDFVVALRNIRPSTSVESIKVFEDWNRDHGTAA